MPPHAVRQAQAAVGGDMSNTGWMQPIESIQALPQEYQSALQQQLMELLVWLTRRFTGADSSSIPVEQAQELLRHIWYCIGQCASTPEELARQPLRTLYDRGEQLVRRKLPLARALLQKVRQTALPIDNLSYQDTLRQLPEFFSRYNSYFAAHEVPCDIDYQLFLPVWELQGVDFVLEYLRALLAESAFCRRFDSGAYIRLLQAFCPDYRELLINLYEPVLVNALGRALLGLEPRALFLAAADQKELQHRLAGLEGEGLELLLLQAMAQLLQALGLVQASQRQYYLDSVQRLTGRIATAVQAGALEELFLAQPAPPVRPAVAEEYQDAPPMPDEQLRSVIEELQLCEGATSRLKVLAEQVHSLADLQEVLPFFEPQELPAVFALLQERERIHLLQLAQQKDPPPDWAQALFEAI